MRQHLLEVLTLVAGEVGDGEALELALLAAEGDAVLLGQAAADQRLVALVLVEHLVELVGGLGLRPEDVAGMGGGFVEAFGRVAVEDRAAEGDVLSRVAVAADRHVAAGHHELELLGARLAEDGDAVLLAVAAAVVFELLVDAFVPLGIDDALEDAADEVLLVLGVEVVILDEVVGDFPVGGDAGSQQAELGVLEVPGEADGFALRGGEGVVQGFDKRLGRGGSRRGGGVHRLRPQSADRQAAGDGACAEGGGAGGLQEVASDETGLVGEEVLAAVAGGRLFAWRFHVWHSVSFFPAAGVY